MPDAVIAMWGWLGAVALAAGAAAVLSRGKVRWGWLAAALLLMAVYDAALTRGYGHIPLDFGPSRWNWEGKTLAVLLSLAVASLPVVGWRRSGLTLHQDRQGLKGALFMGRMPTAARLRRAAFGPQAAGGQPSIPARGGRNSFV